MLELWNKLTLAIFDPLLGWLLGFPDAVVLGGLALLTAGLMVLVRPLATNQDMLKRVDLDRRRLSELIRDAKKARDRQAVLRYRNTYNRLAMRKVAAEGKPLLIAILPLILLATWAMLRVEFHPPRENDVVEVTALFRLSAAGVTGEMMHIVPQPPDLEAVDGWVQPVVTRSNEPSFWDKLLVRLNVAEERTPEPDALAVWKLKGKASTEPYKLLFRFREQTVEHDLLIGQRFYAPAVKDDEQIVTQITLEPVELFGIPGVGDYFPGWLIGYIIIVIPLVFVLKWVLKIY